MRGDLKIHLVSSIEEVLETALMPGEPYALHEKPLAPATQPLASSWGGCAAPSDSPLRSARVNRAALRL